MKPEINKEQYQSCLMQYVHYCRMDIQQNNQMRCPNHGAHKNKDNVFSAHLYDHSRSGKPIVKCFVCGFVGDIYDVAGLLNNTNDFIEQYKIIDKIFGRGEFSDELKKIQESYVKSENKSSTTGELKNVDWVPVKIDSIPKVYNRIAIDECRIYSHFDVVREGNVHGRWYYTDTKNRIIAMDIRFELLKKYNNGKDKLEKVIQTVWYDGRKIRMSGRINIIYNLYQSAFGNGKNKPKLIHEGAKCAHIGKTRLQQLSSVSWNRGVDNCDKADWSFFDGHEVYILQDNDTPGMRAARKIIQELPHSVICTGIYDHFGIGNHRGADIEDLLRIGVKVQDIEQYIFSCDVRKL